VADGDAGFGGPRRNIEVVASVEVSRCMESGGVGL
jgi:hypothetical protein